MGGLGQVWKAGWSYVCMCCESRLFVLMAGSGICIL